LPYSWCRAPEISLPAPDITLFLDILPDKAKQRGGYGEERYEKEDMQRRVREVFGRIGSEMTAASSGDGTNGKWVTVDASCELDDVSDVIWKHIEPLVAGTDLPIQRLWKDLQG
jgi:dTMP kinase